MAACYDDYDRDYNAHLQKIRSYLAGNRSRQTLSECERLLEEARKCASAMQGLAEVEGNPNRVMESKQRIERDIGPLSREVKRQLNDLGRQDLFGDTTGTYQAPNGSFDENYNDMDRLLSNSEDMLRNSLQLCSDSEEVGTSTLLQMGRQREQLETTSGHIDATRSAVEQASVVLRSMGSKAFRNKAFLKGVIVLMGLLNLWAFVHMVRRRQ
ncbi:expressed unknown protein [Seminavis robusta]|uniref:Uncharacterized protein n=1 Tax=Seminavis robusta TaxID=568900 RepID=A0A9N8HZ73_9STRA|nr:expressed unknown protein [Seminavis robusta]|eukprot:Sro3323_g346780.1 n/a (212) ;mRNA; f:3508-4383